MPTLYHAVGRVPTGIILCILLILSATHAGADELRMRDGSRLLGVVVNRSNGILEFKTQFAGKLKVKWSEIAAIRTDKAMKLLLSDDSTLSVTQISNNLDKLVVQADADAPATTLPQSMVEVINPEPWRTGDGIRFSGHSNLALQRERGNTDRDELTVDADVTLRRKRDRFTAFGELERDRSDNRKIKDKWQLDGTYNYFVTRKAYWGAFGRLEHDQFADLDLRSSIGPLVGYQWFESKRMNLRTSTGLSYVNENFVSQSDRDYLALPWTIDFDRQLFNGFSQFYHKQVGFWNLQSTGDVVWDTWTGLRFPLILGLVASTEIKVELDTGAARGAQEVDTTYNLKLGYQW